MRPLLAVTLLLASVVACAQSPECVAPKLPVSVVGLALERIDALTAGDFRLTLNNRPQALAGLGYGESPHSTYILLDSSGSMTASRYWALAGEFVLAAAKRAPQGEVKFAVFGTKVSQFKDRQDLLAGGVPAIQSLVNGGFKNGRTALYDAVLVAIEAMPHFSREDTILVVTDGEDNASKTDYKKLEAKLLALHTRLFVVFIGHPAPPATTQEAAGAENLEELTLNSGGMLFTGLPIANRSASGTQREAPPPAAKEHDQYLAELLAWYSHVQNVFSLDLPPLTTRTKVKVELTSKTDKARLFYPHEVESCAQVSVANR